MANKSSIMIDLDDPKAGNIADVINNKTSREILSLLSEEEMSGSEIASKLKIPLNTVGYNIEKLLRAELIERSKEFLWSTKGKRIYKYKVSNKKIVIFPRTKITRGVIPALILTGITAISIKIFSLQTAIQSKSAGIVETAQQQAESGAAADIGTGNILLQPLAGISAAWGWFLIGAWLALLIVIVWGIWRER